MHTLLPDSCDQRPLQLLDRHRQRVYCAHLFADNPVKGRCNKEIIRRIRKWLALVQCQHNIFTVWTKAHCTTSTPDALVGNVADDRLAAREDAPAQLRDSARLSRRPEAEEHMHPCLIILVGGHRRRNPRRRSSRPTRDPSSRFGSAQSLQNCELFL